MKSRLALLFVLAAASAAASADSVPAEAAAPYVIRGDSSVGGLRIARADVADARLRFGAPSTSRREPPYTCVRSWKRIGLTVAFLDLAGGNACRTGVVVRATITSRGAWRTGVGLRVGDSVARVKRLYRDASYHRDLGSWTGYWLVTRRTCELGGRQPYPGLLARVRNGRVSALVAGTTACE